MEFVLQFNKEVYFYLANIDEEQEIWTKNIDKALRFTDPIPLLRMSSITKDAILLKVKEII